MRLENVKYQSPSLQDMTESGAETVNLNSSAGGNIQAMLVDDVAMNLKVLQAMLKKMNVSCILAESAEEALELLRKGRRADHYPDRPVDAGPVRERHRRSPEAR